MKVKIKKLHPDAIIPKYATDGSGCFDIHAIQMERSISWIRCLYRGDSEIFGTGLAFEIPEDHVLLIYGRSGQAFKHGTRLANCVAVIDSDYRGEVMIKLTREYGSATDPLVVRNGDRIAQGMIVPIPRIEFEEVQELSETVRGDGGLGSTGSSVL